MRWTSAALGLLIGGSLLHLAYVAFGPLSLAPDEAHYWEWSRRVDWSYYSKGPMVAWLIAASTRMIGTSEIGVRAPAILLALATGLVGMRLALDLFASGRAAFLAALIGAALPIYSAGAMLMTIDAPFVFCWALAVWSLWRACRSTPESARSWWALCGIAVGLGVLSKYTMALFVPCAALAVLTTRRRARAADVALAAALAAICCLPIVWWNARHDWVSVRHVLAQTGLAGDARGSLRTVADFVGSQLGVVSPGILAAMAVTVARFFRGRIEDDRPAHAFLLAMSLPVVGFFFLWSLHDKVEANWAAPAWFALAIALAADWDERLRAAASSPSAAKFAGKFVEWIGLALAPGVLLVLVAHFPQTLGLFGLELPTRLDPTSRLRGWRELGATVEALRTTGDGALPLAAASYQIASELAFYAPSHPTVYNPDLGGRRKNQYDIWGGAEMLVGRDVIFVAEGETSSPAFLDTLCEHAQRLTVATLAAPVSSGDPGRKVSVFRCSGYRGTMASSAPTRY